MRNERRSFIFNAKHWNLRKSFCVMITSWSRYVKEDWLLTSDNDVTTFWRRECLLRSTRSQRWHTLPLSFNPANIHRPLNLIWIFFKRLQRDGMETQLENLSCYLTPFFDWTMMAIATLGRTQSCLVALKRLSSKFKGQNAELTSH